MRYRFNNDRAAAYLSALKHSQPLDGVQTKDDLLTLAAVCLSMAEGGAPLDLGPNPSVSQIEKFEKDSVEKTMPLHGAIQLGRHFLNTIQFQSKFENEVEIEISPQHEYPFFAPTSKFVSGIKDENRLDLETSLFFEATV